MKRLLSLRSRRRPAPAGATALVAGQLQHVPTYLEMRTSLESELRRARRYERPLALAVASLEHMMAVSDGPGGPNGNGTGQDGHGKEINGLGGQWLNRYMSILLLGDLLRGSLREADIVGYVPARERFVVCLPECDATDARLATERVGRLLRERTRSMLLVGVAAYPEDALTVDDLLAHAERELTVSPASPNLSLLRPASNV